MRRLGRNDMEQIKVSFNYLTIWVLEFYSPILSVNRLNEMAEVDINPFGLSQWLEHVGILLDRKHARARSIQVNIAVLPNFIFSPSFFTQIQYLLWSSSTLDRHRGNSENGFPTHEIWSQSSHLIAIIELIHWSSWAFWIIQSLSCSRNKVISKLETGCHNKVVIGHLRPIWVCQRVVFWIKTLHIWLNPVNPWCQWIFPGSWKILADLVWVPNSSTNVCIARLVVVMRASIKDCNIRCLEHALINELAWNWGSCCAASDHSNFGMNVTSQKIT